MKSLELEIHQSGINIAECVVMLFETLKEVICEIVDAESSALADEIICVVTIGSHANVLQ